MNKVILVGNLTRDPELRETPNGAKVCTFGLAVSRDYTDSQGNKETDFFNITVWREKGENCYKYLKKGKKVAVVGSLQNRKYEDSEGAMRYVTEIIASEVEFLSPKDQEESVVSVKRETPQLVAIDDNQLPF